MLVLFIATVWQWDFMSDMAWLQLVLWLSIVVCMVVISAYDIRHQQIPMPVANVMLGLGLTLFVVNQLNFNAIVAESALQLLGQLAAAVSLIVLPWAASRGKWMGSGDMFLAALAGLVMTDLISSFAAVLSGFYLGSLYVLPLMALGKADRKSKIPFGPFILSGIFIWYVWEPHLLEFIRQNILLI
jgi:leader peptidase (prepilin peptidase)/N-methyltransferase